MTKPLILITGATGKTAFSAPKPMWWSALVGQAPQSLRNGYGLTPLPLRGNLVWLPPLKRDRAGP